MGEIIAVSSKIRTKHINSLDKIYATLNYEPVGT